MNAAPSNSRDESKITLDYLYVLRKDVTGTGLVAMYEDIPLPKLEQLNNASAMLRSNFERNLKAFCNRIPSYVKSQFRQENSLSKSTRLLEPIFRFNEQAWRFRRRYLRYKGDTKVPPLDWFGEDYLETFVKGWNCPQMPSIEALKEALPKNSSEREVQKEWHAVQQAWRYAVRLCEERGRFLTACAVEYGEYLRRIEYIVPGITRRKARDCEYCRGLSAAYSDAELDYNLGCENREFIFSIEEYYRATVLCDEYQRLAKDPLVIAYSRRVKGWSTFSSFIHEDDNLSLEIKTNFGYGRSSYHILRILYHRIPVVNTFNLIFYRVANLAEVLSATEVFGLTEPHYKRCLDCVSEYFSIYNNLGAKRFCKEYIVGRIEKLAILLQGVLKNNTFLQFTDVDNLSHFSKCDIDTLWLDTTAPGNAVALSESDKKYLQDLAKRLAFGGNVSWQETKECASLYGVEAPVSCMTTVDDSSFTKRFLCATLARDYLLKELSKEQPNRKRNEIDELIPLPENISVEYLEGYKLIEFRVTKANMVMSQLDNIVQILSFSDDSTGLVSIKSSLQETSRQAERYCKSKIEPEANGLHQEVEARKKKITAFEKRCSSLEEEDPEREDLVEKIEKLRKENSQATSRVIELEGQQRFLMGYVAIARNKLV